MEYIFITMMVWFICFYLPGVVFLYVFAEERKLSLLLFTAVYLFVIPIIDGVYTPTLSFKFLPQILMVVSAALGAATLCSVIAEGVKDIEPSHPIRSYGVRLGILVIVVCFFFVTVLVSFPGFHSGKVKNLVKIEEKKVLSTVEPKKVRLVPKPAALAVADKVLGSYKTDEGLVLGSMVEVDAEHTTVQKIGGTLYWVVPLRYIEIFKQVKLGAIPGFIIVDAYDTNKPPKFLQKNPVTGRDYNLNCSMGGYFSRNAHRILRATHITQKLIDFSFEVSDDWKPYIVATVVEPSIWFSEPYKIKGIAVLDLETCKVRDFGLNEIPSWVDRVVPEEVAVNTLDTVGKWSHGFWNGIFTKAYNWMVTNGGMTFVQDGSGKTFWVSAITSAGNDQSAIGIVAVDTRTMKIVKQRLTGPTEDGVVSRVRASLGVNSEVWDVSKPLLYRIYDKLVWVAVVIDKKTFLPTQYAIIDASDVRKIEIDDNFFKAVERFFTGKVVLELTKSVVSWAGKVVRTAVTDSIAYILDSADRIWKCVLEEIPICAFVRDGDEVEMQGIEVEKGKVVRVNKIIDKTLK